MMACCYSLKDIKQRYRWRGKYDLILLPCPSKMGKAQLIYNREKVMILKAASKRERFREDISIP